MSPESRHWLGDGCRAGSCICVVSLSLLVLHAMLEQSVKISSVLVYVQDPLECTGEYGKQRTFGVLLQTTKTRPRLFTMRHASHSFLTADRTLIATIPRLGTPPS